MKKSQQKVTQMRTISSLIVTNNLLCFLSNESIFITLMKL